MRLTKRTVTGKMKVVGEIEGTQFIKDIQYSKHFFRKAKAFGIDADILPDLVKAGVTEIILNDLESGKRYCTPMETFIARKWIHKFDKFQDQLFLALPYWTITDHWGVIEQRAKEIPKEPEPTSVQESLL